MEKNSGHVASFGKPARPINIHNRSRLGQLVSSAIKPNPHARFCVVTEIDIKSRSLHKTPKVKAERRDDIKPATRYADPPFCTRPLIWFGVGGGAVSAQAQDTLAAQTSAGL